MLILILIISFIIYFISLSFFLSGLFKKHTYAENNVAANLSVILCVRNSEKSIENILTDFKNQDYRGNVEFIIIDDNSNDSTAKKIRKFINVDSRFKYFNTKLYKSNLNHKKKAISLGIKSSQYDWLLFTDVNCSVDKNWVSSMAKYYNKHDFIIGFSHIESNNSLVSKFQKIDFNMLMFSALGSSLHGIALASSGQNQSYKKSLYEQINGFEKIKNLLQGDDSIFLQLCKKQTKAKVCFSEDPKSYVLAKTINSWKEFFLQRVRWAGDANIMWKYNKIFFLIIISTFTTNILLPLLIVYSVIFDEYIAIVLFVFSLKLILELSIYFKGNKRLGIPMDFISFLLWFVFQPIYITIMGLFSFFSKYFSWHGRKLA